MGASAPEDDVLVGERFSARLDLTFINRGGSAYTVMDVVIQVVGGDGRSIKVTLDAEPIDVPPFGAQSIVLETPAPASGSILVEAVPMGERWFALPPPGWRGHEPGWLARKSRDLIGWADVPRGVSRELRGQAKPPTPETAMELR